MSAISDFPPPAEYANFMHNTKMLEYLESYIRHFRLESYIRYNQEVLCVTKDDNYDQTGHWNVLVRNQVSIQMNDYRPSM